MKSFTRDGGARIGWSNASIPWATLTADGQGLHLVAFGQRHSFPKDTLRSLSRHQGLFSVGLRIEHLREDCPKLVIFWVSLFPWSSRFEELRADLERLGYRVRG